jgi:hypothetical protein
MWDKFENSWVCAADAPISRPHRVRRAIGRGSGGAAELAGGQSCAVSPPVIPAKAGTHVNLSLRVADETLWLATIIRRINEFVDAHVGPGLRRDDGCGWDVFVDFMSSSQIKSKFALMSRCDHPTGVILGLIPGLSGLHLACRHNGSTTLDVCAASAIWTRFVQRPTNGRIDRAMRGQFYPITLRPRRRPSTTTVSVGTVASRLIWPRS